jgi:hypothetical protein
MLKREKSQHEWDNLPQKTADMIELAMLRRLWNFTKPEAVLLMAPGTTGTT